MGMVSVGKAYDMVIIDKEYIIECFLCFKLDD